MATDAHGATHDEHPPTTIREYVLIGLALTVITVVELWCSYNAHVLLGLLIPILLILSAVKFAVVVAMFMHLRFENIVLTRLFSFGLILVTFVILALTGLFWNDRTDAVGGSKHLLSEPAPAATAAAPAKH